jgi:hypothetical protein
MALPPSPSDNLWTEPESAANVDAQPQYPYNNIQQTESGHSFEMDDTPDRERVRLQHRSGTFIEMHPNGDEVHKVYGTGYEITVSNKNILIKGVCNITIEGDSNIHVMGNKNEKIDGNYNLQVVGDLVARSAGSGGMRLISDSDMSLTSSAAATGALYISAGDHVYMSSDLQVAGSISADTISAESRINAGTGLYAGAQGVYSLGPIISMLSCTAPLGTFPIKMSCGISDAVLMSDTINSSMYNSHIHPTPKGPSGPPSTRFFGV